MNKKLFAIGDPNKNVYLCPICMSQLVGRPMGCTRHGFFDKDTCYDDLEAEVARCRKTIEETRERLIMNEHEIEQTLGKALNYPWFKDDPVNFPNASEKNGVCVGEHVAQSIASEAANTITRLRSEVERLEKQCEELVQSAMNNGKDLLLRENEIIQLRKEGSQYCILLLNAIGKREPSEDDARTVIERVVDYVQELRKGLRQFEWEPKGWTRSLQCPICDNPKLVGHTEKCWLAKLLKEE